LTTIGFLSLYRTMSSQPQTPSSASLSKRPGRSLSAAPQHAGAPLYAASIAPGFTAQTWSIGANRERKRCFVFFIARGRGEFTLDEGINVELTAPVLVWLPDREPGQFRLHAGGEGAMLAAADDFVLRRMFELAAAPALKPLLNQATVAPIQPSGDEIGELRMSFAALVRETRTPSPGASAMAELHFGLVLMHLWRSLNARADKVAPNAGVSTAPRFRQLIELHYRENLSVADYARRLGVSRAHLHDICVRAAGRTPLQWVHDRLMEEAEQRLLQTRLSIEQIGYSLGFRDPGYFNRFFKRRRGLSPGAFRKTAHAQTPKAALSFAAWP
jgi:AraC family transcriptional regulator, transcriptional activator of pobA